MKKFLAIGISISIALNFLVPLFKVHAQQDDNYFIVTAYYSPLPDQDFYITGNYEDEKKLNGQGIAGASGKKVFSGMLAAPQKYNFGTKIYLDGLGIGAVEDRGGAIVEAGNRGYKHDRIDVWVGHGDEGLRRALFWGKRKVYGHIVSSSNESDIEYAQIPAPKWVTKGLKKAYKTPNINIFNTSLTQGSEPKLILSLQSVLEELGYLKDSQKNSKYDSITIDAVYNFQVDNNIVLNEYSLGAGTYGPKTRKALQQAYTRYLEEKQAKEIFLAKLDKIKTESLLKAENHIATIGNPYYGEISPNVRELQKTLASLGYFEYKDTAIFGVKTQNAIISYQIENKIIQNERQQGAGVFGPKTKNKIIEDMSHFYFSLELKNEDLLAQYNKYTHKNIDISQSDSYTGDMDVFKI